MSVKITAILNYMFKNGKNRIAADKILAYFVSRFTYF